jgi:hypothetical protein
MRTVLPLAASLLASATCQAFDDGRGRDWRALVETTGKPTWEQVAAVCPTDGVSPCTGPLGDMVLKDWVWATREQVAGLFSLWAPPILQDPDGVGGYGWQVAAGQFQAVFGVSTHLKGCPKHQPCFDIRFSTGMTASTVPGSPSPCSGEVWVDLHDGGGGFQVIPSLHPETGRGLWMWRPTGLGTASAHAYDDVGRLAQPGAGTVVPNVMANDWVAGQRATTANALLTALSSPAAGLWLEDDGSVRAAAGLAAGRYSLQYRLCNRASPSSCDDAIVTLDLREGH